MEASRALAERGKVYFVKWDRLDGQLRYLNRNEIKSIFNDNSLLQTEHPYCSRVSYRFGDSLKEGKTCLLFPEVPYFLEGGNEVFARIISQCREYKIISSAIFYDLIPLRDRNYATYKNAHISYISHLLRCDFVFTISNYVRDDLIDYFENLEFVSSCELEVLKQRIIAVNLGEYKTGEPRARKGKRLERSEQPLLIMVGTIEPRKQQVRFLKVLNNLLPKKPELTKLRVEIYGSLHPESSEGFYNELKRNSSIIYHQYASDDKISASYSRAWFSVFLSYTEGFGLPIVESLNHGVPCLCSNFGAMQEVAEGGGCLTINALDDTEIEKGLLKILCDHKLRQVLGEEISRRRRRSWKDYAVGVLGHINNQKLPTVAYDDLSTLGCDETADFRNKTFFVSVKEKVFCDFCKSMKENLPREKTELAIVIPTYNRSKSVKMKTEAILKQIKREKLNVKCIVLDDASMDDTFVKLNKFRRNRNFRYICNPTHVGVLGNLGISSTVDESSYVWVVGDDACIMKGAMSRTLQAINAYRGIPFLFYNFEACRGQSTDGGCKRISETWTAAQKNKPAGVYKISQIVPYFDNLYQVVFRSDIFAACFNHPFEGNSFGEIFRGKPGDIKR